MERWVDGRNEEGRKSGETISRSPMSVVVISNIEGLKEKECFLRTVLPGNDLILVPGTPIFRASSNTWCHDTVPLSTLLNIISMICKIGMILCVLQGWFKN